MALENMEILAQEDVRKAWIEMERTKNQIGAAAATLRLQEEKMRAETEKYRVGKSTSLLVAQAQRDLLQSRVNEAQSVADYLKSLAGLFVSEGILLEQYGISLPD